MRSQHYPQFIDAALDVGNTANGVVESWATRGQQPLFDGNTYTDHSGGWMEPGISDEYLSDQDVFGMLGDTGLAAYDGEPAPSSFGWEPVPDSFGATGAFGGS